MQTDNIQNKQRGYRMPVWVWRVLSLSICMAMIVVVVACKQETTAVAPIRIGYLPIYVDLPLFVAKQEGFFERRGVKVDLVRFAQSPDLATSLHTGDVKVGASVAFAVILSGESRDPGALKVFIVDSEDKENYLSSFVTLPGSGIKTLKDLKGRRVASFPGPQAMVFCRLVLESAGLVVGKDVEVIELQSSSHISALQSRTVDALFTYEPIATQAVQELGATKFLPAAVESLIMSPWQAGLWVMSAKFQREHPVEAAAVIGALYDAIDFIRRDPKMAKTALNDFTSIRAGVAEATPTIPFAKLGEVDTLAMQRQADILFKQHVVSKEMNAVTMLAPLSWLGKKQ